MKKKSIISLLLALLMLCPIILLACDTTTPPDDSTGDNGDDTTAEAEEFVPLTLADQGQTEFYLIYPDEEADAYMALANALRNSIEKFTGAKVIIRTDLIREGATGDYGKELRYEILLGPTNRKESQAVINEYTLKSRDYFIGARGDKIVIASTNSTAADNAVNKFIATVIATQGKQGSTDSKVVVDQSHTYHFQYSNYSIGSCTILGEDLSQYSIVYPRTTDYYSPERYARLLSYELSLHAGYDLPVNNDNSPKDPDGTKREIVFGNTTRGGEVVTTKHGFTVKATGTKLFVNAECLEGYLAAYKYLTETLFKGDEVKIDEGFTYSGVADPAADGREYIDTHTGEYRVMFHNIYGYTTDTAPIAIRNAQNAELHLEYLPDVIGVQEAASGTRAANGYFVRMKTYGYTEITVTVTNSDKVNYTPLLYRADKLDVIDKGYHLYNDKAGDKSKGYTWAIFKDKASGDVFCVVSTHFYWKSDELGQSARKIDAAELSQGIAEIAAKYNCPIIVGGDFNCRINSEPFGIMTNNGFKLLQRNSAITCKLHSHHAYPIINTDAGVFIEGTLPSGTYDNAIDHAILYNGGTSYEGTLFHIIWDEYAILSGDHCPVMVEFNIK